jgi:hypothetical protein
MSSIKFIDIGANMLDEMFLGVYRDKHLHEPDVEHVLTRAKEAGAECIIVTAGTIEDSLKAIEFCELFNVRQSEGLFPLLKTTVSGWTTRNGRQLTHIDGVTRLASTRLNRSDMIGDPLSRYSTRCSKLRRKI